MKSDEKTKVTTRCWLLVFMALGVAGCASHGKPNVPNFDELTRVLQQRQEFTSALCQELREATAATTTNLPTLARLREFCGESTPKNELITMRCTVNGKTYVEQCTTSLGEQIIYGWLYGLSRCQDGVIGQNRRVCRGRYEWAQHELGVLVNYGT